MRNILTYSKLCKNDKIDIKFLKNCHNIPEIKKFISISKNYFDYVTDTKNVFYYKILLNNEIVGGLHLEVDKNILYPAIWILPAYQRQGIAENVVCDIQNNYFSIIYDKIHAGIEKDNIKSLFLFNKLGFKQIDIEDGIINVEFVMNK